jgi:hypothetical protein
MHSPAAEAAAVAEVAVVEVYQHVKIKKLLSKGRLTPQREDDRFRD